MLTADVGTGFGTTLLIPSGFFDIETDADSSNKHRSADSYQYYCLRAFH
jgi:hypothetical protein